MSLRTFYDRFRGYLMLAAKEYGKATALKVRVPGGIFDFMALPCFEQLCHSFEDGNRHLTTQTYITDRVCFAALSAVRARGRARPRSPVDTAHVSCTALCQGEIQQNFGLIACTVAHKIQVDVQTLPDNRPHICMVMFNDDAKHRVGFNPTARQLEVDLTVSWFSSTGGYIGGHKRPDPPDDGLERIFHLHNREWALVDAVVPDAPASVSALSRAMGGAPEYMYV